MFAFLNFIFQLCGASLLKYNWFYISIFCPKTLLHLFISPSSCRFPWFFYVSNHIIYKYFYFFLFNLYVFSFSCLLQRQAHQDNTSGNCGHPCGLFPISKYIVYFSPLIYDLYHTYFIGTTYQFRNFLLFLLCWEFLLWISTDFG